ncbi:hypothetical protein JW968_05265 [Candidatus Woesearchaeota archaeon]|nr:hypothetical protein [Candidatus Woesearchaeota archaeon]
MNNTQDNLKRLVKSIETSTPKKFGRLNFAYIRVLTLLDYMRVIDKNAKQLQVPENMELIKTGQSPSQRLWEYIILEIVSFYNLARKYNSSSTIHFPKFPKYLNKLERFRNKIIAHLDDEEELKSGKDWLNAYSIINNIGFEMIVNDFDIFYKDCVRLFSPEFM